MSGKSEFWLGGVSGLSVGALVGVLVGISIAEGVPSEKKPEPLPEALANIVASPDAAIPVPVAPVLPPLHGYVVLGACFEGVKWGTRPVSNEWWYDGSLPSLCLRGAKVPDRIDLMTRWGVRVYATRWPDSPFDERKPIAEIKPTQFVTVHGITKHGGGGLDVWVGTVDVSDHMLFSRGGDVGIPK